MRPPASPIRVGFSGKIPSRGDFVRARLSSAFVNAWDEWMRQVLPGSERILGEAWAETWRAAAPWRFALPAGQCGPHCVVGLWLPSTDRVGRAWPLVIAAEGAAAGEDFLEEAERLGRSVLDCKLSPELFAAALGALPAPDPGGAPTLWNPAWWRLSPGEAGSEAGGEARPEAQGGLPDVASFTAMLRP